MQGEGNKMYSTKVLGSSGHEITNQSTVKAVFEASVKAKKSFGTKPAK